MFQLVAKAVDLDKVYLNKLNSTKVQQKSEMTRKVQLTHWTSHQIATISQACGQIKEVVN